MVLSGSSSISTTIPAGYNYVVDTGSKNTVTGSDVAIITGTVGGSYNVTGTSTVAVQGGTNTVKATGNYVLSTSSTSNNGIIASGTGTVATNGSSTVRSGGSNVVLSNGSNELVVGASGATTITASGNGSGVLGAGGAITANITGGAATVAAGNSTTTVTLSGSNAVAFGGTGTTAGALSVVDAGTNDTIATFASNATVVASGSTQSLVFGGTGLLDFVGGAGASTVIGGTGGSEVMTVGAGGIVFSAGTNNMSTIVGSANAGLATIFGGSGSQINLNESISGTTGGAFLLASGGQETLNAALSNTNNLFSGGADSTGAVSMVGGSGSNTFFAGSGADTMTGGTSSNLFAFFAANTKGGTDYITNFNANDILVLSGYDTTLSAAKLLSTATTGQGGVTITLSDSTKITFTNLTDTTALTNRITYS
ncbi:MAG: hypothetical protein B7Z80_09680 [Rhodospirillales bacterium 20-64-7]|nr:MAG: hypothetical protein B7Z80_09680 [Rhodospirillales bacterium 20-64-7]